MKKANGQQLSLFDITLEHNIKNVNAEPPTVSETVKTEKPIAGGDNLCPYPTPSSERKTRLWV